MYTHLESHEPVSIKHIHKYNIYIYLYVYNITLNDMFRNSGRHLLPSFHGGFVPPRGKRDSTDGCSRTYWSSTATSKTIASENAENQPVMKYFCFFGMFVCLWSVYESVSKTSGSRTTSWRSPRKLPRKNLKTTETVTSQRTTVPQRYFKNILFLKKSRLPVFRPNWNLSELQTFQQPVWRSPSHASRNMSQYVMRHAQILIRFQHLSTSLS